MTPNCEAALHKLNQEALRLWSNIRLAHNLHESSGSLAGVVCATNKQNNKHDCQVSRDSSASNIDVLIAWPQADASTTDWASCSSVSAN
jgi:hypothetical protein